MSTRTRSIVNKLILKQSVHIYIKNFKKWSEANWFILKLDNIEAKRTCSIVILFLKKQIEQKAKKQKASIVEVLPFLNEPWLNLGSQTLVSFVIPTSAKIVLVFRDSTSHKIELIRSPFFGPQKSAFCSE